MLRTAVALLSCVVSVSAVAQEADATVNASASAPSVGALLTARLRYGVVARRGNSVGVGPGVIYDGITPNDFALQGSYFGHGYVGGFLSLQRESFALSDIPTGDFVTATGLFRVTGGPSAR